MKSTSFPIGGEGGKEKEVTSAPSTVFPQKRKRLTHTHTHVSVVDNSQSYCDYWTFV